MPTTRPRLALRTPGRDRAGFTLLEVLLSISITGIILGAAITLIVSVSTIWSNRQDKHFFEGHVDGVTEFLDASLRRAGRAIRIDGTSGNTNPEDASSGNSDAEPGLDAENNDGDPEVSISVNSGADSRSGSKNGATDSASLLHLPEDPISWKKPPGFPAYEDPLLHFTLNDQPPLLVNADNAPAVGLEVFLHFEPDEGLSLLWYSKLQEETEDERDLRRSLLSPFVESLRYVYWDERFERWEEESEPLEGDNNELRLPRYLKLIFNYEGVPAERNIAIPLISRQALLF